MATMLPADIEQFTTPGEGVFYRFLQACARPDDRYIAWYQPDIRGLEPDFILYAPDAGLVIFEVKDWVLDQIVAADPHHFTLLIGGKEERRKNPLSQTRDYFGGIMGRIKEDGRLVSHDPSTWGQVKVTVNTGVVFPNINRHEYEQKGLHDVIASERVIFWDDLHPQSPVCADVTGGAFRERLDRMLTVRPRFTITGRELDHLRRLIFPVVRIDLPDRAGRSERDDAARRLAILDHQQESIARKYDGGHRIITGPSGSGKTLILVHRAALLMRYNPSVKRILFVCYNITLVNYLRRLLAEKQVPLGENGVEVCHFFQLCAKLTGEEVPYEKADSEFYDLVVQETLEKLPSVEALYDAVLIDEGQDFTDDMLKVCTGLLNPATDHLAIALDDNQDIYERESTWKKAGIKARGRVHRVSWNYRNTQEIARCAESVLDGLSSPSPEPSPQGTLFPETFEAVRGMPPELVKLSDHEAIARWVAEGISRLTGREGYPPSDIAVIYVSRYPEGSEGVHLPRLLGQELEKKGILADWISEDYRSKHAYDVTTDKVTISTIHSVKGFDYACLFVLGLDGLEPGNPWSDEQTRKLAYVALTRARERLFIPYCGENDILRRLMSA